MSTEKLSLEKLNYMYQQVRQMASTINSLKTQFADHVECESWENPFDVNGDIDRIVGDVKTNLSRFLIQRYQECFCRNVPVHKKIGKYEEWFPEQEFDAVKFIDRINEKILPNNPERVAYDTIRKGALEILPYNWGNLKKRYVIDVKKNVLRGECYPDVTKAFTGYNGQHVPKTVRLSHDSASRVMQFEKFVCLILDNQDMFHRVPPTQLRGRTPIGNSIWNLQYDQKNLPQTIEVWSGPIEKAVFFKNGRVDFHFNRENECQLIAEALASDEPVITFPEHEIDMNQLFEPIMGDVPRRVVKKRNL